MGIATRQFGLVGVVVAIDEARNAYLKHVFERARPRLFEEVATLHSYSFPSGHATAAIAIYGMIAFVVGRLAPRLRLLAAGGALALAVSIGISRIYLGVHWVTDVLAGYAAGAIILSGGIVWVGFGPRDDVP